jgi:hypothetical protein
MVCGIFFAIVLRTIERLVQECKDQVPLLIDNPIKAVL